MSIFDQTFTGSILVLSDHEGEANKTKVKTKSKRPKNMNVGRSDIFESEWLNKGLSEARRLKRLRKIEQAVSEELASHLGGELDSQVKQQALFALLGIGFVQKHFPHHKNNPKILDDLEPWKKEKALDEMKAFLDEKVLLCLANYKEENGIEKKLLKDIREIFSSDMNAKIHKQLEKERKIKIKQGRKGRTKVVELVDTIPDRVKFVETALTDMLTNVPEVSDMVLKELKKRVLILPNVYRQQLFDRLYMGNGQSISDAERCRMKRQYTDRVKVVLKKNNLANVGEWSGRKAVDAEVILAFERSAALKEEFEVNFEDLDGDGIDDRLVFYTRILAIAKLCDFNSSPTHIFWLVRATNYFPDSDLSSKEDKAINVAFHFDKFSQTLAVFNTRKVFNLAQDAYDILEQEETKLLIKINEALADTSANVDPTVYSQSILMPNEERGLDVIQRFLKTKTVAEQDLSVFSDFRLLLRKWLSEAFIGSTSKNGASLIWDLLFVHKFDEVMAVNVCLTLVHLLKPMLEEADSARQVRHVMMEGPKMLLIRDLRRVLQHFSQGGVYGEIPVAPQVPPIQITPPSARAERQALDRRIEALNLSQTFS